MEQLKVNLLYVLNHCELPIEAAYYVTKDVFRELEDAYNQYLTEQRIAEAQAKNQTPEPEEDEDAVVEE